MIKSETKYFPPADDALPALVLQVTHLVDSYMLWIGVTDERPENAPSAILKGNLCRDWACAMPASSTNTRVPPTGTSLFRSSTSDLALTIAQRLARRFKKQIFLSVDLPPSFISMEHGPKLTFEAEKRLVETLREMEHLDKERPLDK